MARRPLRVAVEGCAHGTFDAIYKATEKACKERKWPGVDVLIIGGDFQAARNIADLSVMSVPVKYAEMGDFHKYYSGEKKAPYLTIFVGGNHEAASHMAELYYGGWVAPNIYYMGAANVLRVGPLRIAGMSGIWKGFDYRKAHHERLPFSRDAVKSFYHVRELDVRKLLQIREQVDVGISHDWPRGIERHGDYKALFKAKDQFEAESNDGTLGNPAAEYVMDRLRPPHWFSAHLHCRHAAIKIYEPPGKGAASGSLTEPEVVPEKKRIESDATDATSIQTFHTAQQAANQDEIDLAMDDDAAAEETTTTAATATAQPNTNPDEIDLDMDDGEEAVPAKGKSPATSKPVTINFVEGVSNEILAELPAAFARPQPGQDKYLPKTKRTPGQPVPDTIKNTEVRFLALDKCTPGRKFLQLMEIDPISESQGYYTTNKDKPSTYRLEYDPEWLAITRVFAPDLVIGEGPNGANPAPDLGEAHYLPLIKREREWVDENIVKKNKLGVPENFMITAPPHGKGMPEKPKGEALSGWGSPEEQPDEYTNPQTAAFCELVGVENLWDASEGERLERKAAGVPEEDMHPAGFRGGGPNGGRGRARRGLPRGNYWRGRGARGGSGQRRRG